MYKPAQTVVFPTSVYNEDGFMDRIETLVSNGKYTRWPDGRLVSFPTKDKKIFFFFEFEKKHFMCKVEDSLIESRIVEYIHEYFDKYLTNCASFAHFVMTGEFQECCPKKGYLIIESYMQTYKPKKPVSVGDVVCILYGKNRFINSRKLEMHSKFVRARKRRHDTGEFVTGIEHRKSVLSPEDIKELYGSGWARDFHFMVCINHHKGKPVWLSQRGYHNPGTPFVPFVITVGNNDPYPENTPIIVLKKRNK